MSRTRPASVLAILLLLIGAPCATARAATEPRYIDYLHIEANEGGSSGGHVALQFGADTFHFQQEDGGLIRMRRDDAEMFHFRYAMLGNRPIHETRIAVSDETFALLRDTFTERLLIQTAHYERRTALAEDVALFDLWLRRLQPDLASGEPVRGAGYFLHDGFTHPTPAAQQSSALVAVGAQIAAVHGERFIADRIAAIRTELATWQPRALREPPPPLAIDAYPQFALTASAAYREQLEALTALEVLATAAPLRKDATRALDVPLSAGERRALTGFAAELRSALAALAVSPRRDLGYPLLVGLARLAAIDASLASGRLMILDAFAPDAFVVPLPTGAERDAYLGAVVERLGPATQRARDDLFAGATFREGDYTHLETVANRLLEAEDARRQGTPLRAQSGLLLPARSARRDELIALPLPASSAAAERAAAIAAVRDYRLRLAALYGYNLITRNCVSEVFATIDAALGGRAGDESRRRLGGIVRTANSLNFIPTVSAGAVAENYAAVSGRSRPSYRQLRLQAFGSDEPGWRVSLRESNTLTATAYHRDRTDSTFLFFTDDTIALRPVLGLANLLFAIGNSAVGLVTWPADTGARLDAGLRGAFFSLPEIAFVNIRKGSMAWVEPDVVTSGWTHDARQ